MIAAVCVSRDFRDSTFLYARLMAFHSRQQITALLCYAGGDATNAIGAVRNWGENNRVRLMPVGLDRSIGVLQSNAKRNDDILDLRPAAVLLFGTSDSLVDMMRKAVGMGIPVYHWMYGDRPHVIRPKRMRRAV